MIFLAALLLSGIVAIVFMVVMHIEGLTHKDPKLDLESHRYADAAIVAVIKNWNEDALLARGSSELTAAAEFEINLDSVFRRWRALGPMVEYEGSSGKASVTFSTETGRIVAAIYIARASFQHGTARIKIGLVKRRVWKVASFQVFPTMLSTPAGPPPPVRKLLSPAELKPYTSITA